MSKTFFACDNKLAKLASWLILIPSLLTLAMGYFQIPDQTLLALTIASGLLATAGSMLRRKRRVYTHAFWFAFAYTLATYLTSSPDVHLLFPDALPIMGFLGAGLKLVTGFSVQDASSPVSPTATRRYAR